ncbi:MAG: hypothetical protein NZZ41_02890 [Candidatus Dojkabacteria bacterium]|nr:hypothetical protein [Candidatus Dojkabacteria bacterium]
MSILSPRLEDLKKQEKDAFFRSQETGNRQFLIDEQNRIRREFVQEVKENPYFRDA